MSVTDWSPQPSGNALADPSIKAARDGASARELSPSIRGLMAKTAALALDQNGALVSTGTENAYEIATNSGFTEIKPGVSLSFWANRDNTGEPTLNVDGSGPRRWLSADGLALPAGAVQGGLLYTVAWNAALASWRMIGGAAGLSSTGLPGFNFSGTLVDRAQYDAQPKDKVFLAIADTPNGASWTLYVKRSNAFGDWSSGLPIKASPAQSTADAQTAAALAQQRLSAAEDQVRLAQRQAVAATEQADASATQAQLAAIRADNAASALAETRLLAGLVGALSYDMGTLDQPSDGSANFDFGSL